MKCLYNTYSDNVSAYCHNQKHPYAMTPAQVHEKNCLGKQCEHFEIEPSHPYWKQRAAMKQKRKNRKKRIDDYVNRIQSQVQL